MAWLGVCILLAAAAAHAGEVLVADAYRLDVPDGYAATQDAALHDAARVHASALCTAAGYDVAPDGTVTSYARGTSAVLVAVRLDGKGPIASVAAIPPEWLVEVSRRATGGDASTARKVLVGTRGAVPAVEVRGSFDRGDHAPNPARTLIVPRRQFVLVVTLAGVSAVGAAEVEPAGSPWSLVLDSLEVHAPAPAPAKSAAGDPFPFVLVAGGGAALLLVVVVFLASRRRGDRVAMRPPAPVPASGSAAPPSGSIRAADGLPTFDRRAAEPEAPPSEHAPAAASAAPKPAATPRPAPARPPAAAKPAAPPTAPPRTGPPRITGNSPVVEGAPAAAAPARTAKISRNTDFLAG